MIVATSQFRAANGIEAAVTEVFRRRRHLVEQASGLLGTEVYTNHDDPSVFTLITRWTDVTSFKVWHASEAQTSSHAGIRNGLRLDSAYTKVTILDQLLPDQAIAGREALAHGFKGFFARHIWSSPGVHILVCGVDGGIRETNPRMAQLLGVAAEQLRGSTIRSYLTEADAATLEQRLRSGPAQSDEIMLNFVSVDDVPHTLECTFSIQGDTLAIIGSASPKAHELLQRQLMETNNELSVLLREHATRNKELSATKLALEKTLHELGTLYWNIRRYTEVLPVCLKCGRVESALAGWQAVTDFMHERFPFLSHGYCPECASRGSIELDESGPD